MPPGTRALAFSSKWFDSQTVANVFEPLVADWQREWRDAAGFARFGVRIRGGSALLLSMISASPNVLFAAWPARTLRRVMTRVMIWTTIVTALMLAPFVIDLGWRVNVELFLYLLVLLVPQAVALAFPFAVTTIVDVIRTAPRPTREERIAALKFAIAACALMLILAGWVYPYSNQQYRVTSMRAVTGTIYGAGSVRGLRELSIVELLQDDTNCRQWLGKGDPIFDQWCEGRANPMARELSSRLSLSLLPVAFMWMRWRALQLPRGRWYSALPLTVSAPITFAVFMFFFSQQSGLAYAFYAPQWLAPWLALGIVIFGTLVVDRLRGHFARIL